MSKKIDKQAVVDYYLSQPMTLDQIANKFNLCKPTISKILDAYNIPRYAKAKLFNPDVNEHFFEKIDNEFSAYFLGLIISDGNVFKDNTNRQSSISITLDSNDEYILDKFKKSVNTNTKVSQDGRGCSQIAVRSNIMADDLANYGVVPKKSFNTYLPNISNEYMSHLIRGIFDGDGSILMKPSPKNDGRNRYLHTISFCGTHKLMQDISNYIYDNLKLNVKPKVYDYKNRLLSEFKIANIHDIEMLGEYMYKDASIYLYRKYDKYLEFKEHYYNKNERI